MNVNNKWTLQPLINFLKKTPAQPIRIEPKITAAGDGEYCLGRSSREAPETDGEIYVRCGKPAPEPGLFVPVRITSAGDYDLKGEML